MDQTRVPLLLSDRLVGCLIGTAVGDSVGLVAEGLSAKRIERRYPGPWRQRLGFGRGMVSDDTDHAFLVAQALLVSRGEVANFRSALAWRLRGWLASLPAGTGLATARAILKLWLGWPARSSGVWSAGNGPCMRVALIGVLFANDESRRRALVDASTRMTHRDPKATTAALAVAETASWLCGGEGDLLSRLQRCGDDREWGELVAQMKAALSEGTSVSELARRLGCERGITAYAYRTVPLALYAVLRHRKEPRTALETLFRCGGDTDTTGAIAGALLGADGGERVFPTEWVDRIADWPRGMEALRASARRLAEPTTSWKPVRYAWPLMLLRNVAFFAIVLAHGFRRLVP